MEPFTADVTEAVRAAADAALGYPGSLADVHRRARRRRGRQRALFAAAVATVLATAGIGVAVRREPAPQPPAVTGVTGDRLIVLHASGTYRAPRGGTVELHTGDIGELLPNGGMVVHRVGPALHWQKVVGLPQGGFVALGLANAAPASRYDPHLTDVLVHTGADGKVLLQRDVRRGEEPVRLLTATESTAYLLRRAGLVAHDLTTGAERPFISAAALGVSYPLDSIRAADLSGERLAVAGKDGCVVTVLDGASAVEFTRLPSGVQNCEQVTGVRLSPNSDMAAVSYQAPDRVFGVVVFRLADGAVLGRSGGVAVHPETWTATEMPPLMERMTTSLIGLAWQDDHTVRGVSYLVGVPHVHGLEQFTITW